MLVPLYDFYYPQAGWALPFPIDEKEAKILSQRTLTRALGRPAHLSEDGLTGYENLFVLFFNPNPSPIGEGGWPVNLTASVLINSVFCKNV
ncbi:MAG: hypothetical protein A2W90_07370 [Bacteroidetes bacterium GWF2_42_66]|nr:MAG: hypothetical protein A2W92_07360 [Bacteroidetes bacterium GWA2_42_15]OFX96910.1 MAG: hypothetical protein A2W89_20070 [Bacteroidetes bacterium GWE2_42_39]OFY44667.1 MAG: hypothetical protein A2W90_07370 [Bacteroidetes bacterium GWF2_42_66]HAZ02754.1 hypothetical protein [Marinilabiliales bacterium]HBL75047.1 hypothetical protein [Prolixibacteraceae bacterium]